MFAGHLGAALALGRLERRLNVGWLVAAALLLDFVLWLLVLGGIESVEIGADFVASRQPRFAFPYSHGFVASLGWSLLVGVAAGAASARPGVRRASAAAVAAAAVFSHWALDALVHREELPLAGESSRAIGLGLWNVLPLGLAVEAALVAAGVWLFAAGSVLPRRRTAAIAAFALVVLALTIGGMLYAPPPPSPAAMAASSFVTLVAIAAIFLRLGRTGASGRAS